MNRIYFVYEPDENSGVMVAAESNNQAKMLGCYDIGCEYIEVRARLVKGGDHFYDDLENRNKGIDIIGDGPIETDLHGVLDWESNFKNPLIDMGRGQLFTEEDEEDLCALDQISDDIIDRLNTNVPPDRKCRVCGCTPDQACPGGCFWVEEDLCSSCASECEEPQP